MTSFFCTETKKRGGNKKLSGDNQFGNSTVFNLTGSVFSPLLCHACECSFLHRLTSFFVVAIYQPDK